MRTLADRGGHPQGQIRGEAPQGPRRVTSQPPNSGLSFLYFLLEPQNGWLFFRFPLKPPKKGAPWHTHLEVSELVQRLDDCGRTPIHFAKVAGPNPCNLPNLNPIQRQPSPAQPEHPSTRVHASWHLSRIPGFFAAGVLRLACCSSCPDNDSGMWVCLFVLVRDSKRFAGVCDTLFSSFLGWLLFSSSAAVGVSSDGAQTSSLAGQNSFALVCSWHCCLHCSTYAPPPSQR